MLNESSMKTCVECGVDKPLGSFYLNGAKGRRTRCIVCFKKQTKAYGEKNKTRRSDQARVRLLATYGLTPKDYNDKLLDQNGKCSICGIHQTYSEEAFVVDHCHKSGQIRSLLCPPCNKGLGFFRDDGDILKAAINYLRHHE